MTLTRAAVSVRNVAVLTAIGAFASAALWLLAPVQRNEGSSSTPSGTAVAVVYGAVQAEAQGDVVTRLVVPLAIQGESGIAVTADSGRVSAEIVLSDTAAAVVPGTYTLVRLDGNGDTTLDPGEHVELRVVLPANSTIRRDVPVNLLVKSGVGAPLVIENVLGD